MKKTLRKALSLALALCCLLSLAAPTSAAEVAEATIDESAACSIKLYSYDWTNAVKDGVWDASYVSTGKQDSNVQTILGSTPRKGDLEGDKSNALENGGTSNGYAVKGKEYTYIRVADIVTFTESVNDQHPEYSLTKVLYGFDKIAAADLLTTIGLGNGSGSYANAANTDKLDQNNWYYESDVLNNAMNSALAADSTATKSALESYAKANGTAMPLTDEDGYTSAAGLKVGLYLVVETRVPEMVTSGTAPFFISLPMTSVDGTNATDGGTRWIYDVTLYPKNETGIVTLTKEVREAQKDTGKNGGSDAIDDGYDHNATASTGDTVDYQIISTLPSITSKATYLTTYTFFDTLSEGLAYTRGDVKIEWFTDTGCTNKVATWTEADGKFAVTYSAENEMTIAMTDAGLAEINASAGTVDNINDNTHTNVHGDTEQYAGYSNYTLRITYTAKINSDQSFVFGDNANLNTVTLTWSRTSSEYYDILVDDCHVYSFGLDLTKKFSDMTEQEAADADMYKHVKFKIWNDTDKYWVAAQYNSEEGIYYVTGHVADEADATIFTPRTAYPNGTAVPGAMIVKGLEDDTYIITELETANGYVRLKDSITMSISVAEDENRPCSVYADEAKLGVYQNDGHYYFEGCPDLPLANIPQVQLAHVCLTGDAVVDTNDVVMENDTDATTGEATDSTNALVPVTVVNDKGFDLPQTGSHATQILVIMGSLVAVAGIAFIFFLFLPKRKEEK